MSVRNDTTSLPTVFRRNRWDPLSDSERRKFRVQSTPPLSLRQFFRSTTTVNPGGKQWKPTGFYHASVVHESPSPKSPDDSPEIVVKSRNDSRPAWYPSGPIKYKRPKSPSEKNKLQKSEGITTDSRTNTNSNRRSKTTRKLVLPWHPSGNPYYDSVPYFDPPSLRWLPQQIKQSMPEFKPTTNHSSTNQK